MICKSVQWEPSFIVRTDRQTDRQTDRHDEFYVYGSVHRWSILLTVQRDATQSSLFIILQVHSTCFECQTHPSSGVHKTVTTASCTGHIFMCSYLRPTWPSLATLEGGRCTATEAVVTVLCTPVDGCGWHREHVEWTCRIINRLLCVASRWTISNIEMTKVCETRLKGKYLTSENIVSAVK